MSFNNIFNRSYEMTEFPYFVPKEELEYNLDYARKIVDGDWISKNWEIMFPNKNNYHLIT